MPLEAIVELGEVSETRDEAVADDIAQKAPGDQKHRGGADGDASQP